MSEDTLQISNLTLNDYAIWTVNLPAKAIEVTGITMVDKDGVSTEVSKDYYYLNADRSTIHLDTAIISPKIVVNFKKLEWSPD